MGRKKYLLSAYYNAAIKESSDGMKLSMSSIQTIKNVQ